MVQVGSCSLVARLGAMLSITIGLAPGPEVGMFWLFSTVLNSTLQVPTAVFAGLALTSGLVSLLLPETHGQPLPETVEQSEAVPVLQPGQWLSLSAGRRTSAGTAG